MNFLPFQRSLPGFRNSQLKPREVLAAMIGVVITISASILSIHLTNKLIASIQVSSNPLHWVHIARVQAYGVCYDGCNDCLDVASIEEACRLTTKVEVQGVVCAASEMWSWEERYPLDCLEAVGELYKADALKRKRFWFKAFYLLTLLALPLGYAAYCAMLWVIVRFDLLGEKTFRPRIVKSGNQGRSSSSRTPLLAAAILAVAFPTLANGYACVEHNPAHNQLFSNTDNSIYGVIHGWLSNCYDYTYSCGETCTTATDSSNGGHRSCDTNYCTRPRTDKKPRDYVNDAVPFVTGCGFRLVDVVPGVVDRRIPNPRIEGRLGVKVAVNRFNGTSGLEEQVKCLYEMVEAPRW